MVAMQNRKAASIKILFMPMKDNTNIITTQKNTETWLVGDLRIFYEALDKFLIKREFMPGILQS